MFPSIPTLTWITNPTRKDNGTACGDAIRLAWRHKGRLSVLPDDIQVIRARIRLCSWNKSQRSSYRTLEDISRNDCFSGERSRNKQERRNGRIFVIDEVNVKFNYVHSSSEASERKKRKHLKRNDCTTLLSPIPHHCWNFQTDLYISPDVASVYSLFVRLQ